MDFHEHTFAPDISYTPNLNILITVQRLWIGIYHSRHQLIFYLTVNQVHII